MATIYIEPRPKSRAEGARIEYYVAETEEDTLLEDFPDPGSSDRLGQE